MSGDTNRTPVIFLSHGAGPCWYMDAKTNPRFKDIDKHSASAEFMRNLQSKARLPRTPRAILVVSAHWEESEHTVTSSAKPKLYYDYGGFPEETYRIEWPVPGAPDVAKRVRELLAAAGIRSGEDGERGLDHGVFVPLKLAYPAADIPVLQLSLRDSLSVPEHLQLGEALAPLSAEGVLIVGSGQTTHSSHLTDSGLRSFQVWFNDVMTNPTYTPAERKRRILAGKKEDLSQAHGRIEHYLPAVVALAAAGYAAGTVEFEQVVMGSMLMSHVRFGGA